MPSGLEVLNVNGNLVIDSNFANMHIVAQGSATVPAGVFASVSIYVPNPVDQPFLIFTKSSKILSAGAYIMSGSQYAGISVHSPTEQTTFDYFIAARRPVSAGNSGLQVFDSSGSLVFDSSNRYLKIVDVLRVDIPSATQVGVYSHASVGNSYVCTQAGNRHLIQDEFASTTWWMVRNISDSQIEVTLALDAGLSGDFSAYLTPSNNYEDVWGPRTMIIGTV